MNRSLIFRDEMGRFTSRPSVQAHTAGVNPLKARAQIAWKYLDVIPRSDETLCGKFTPPPGWCYTVSYLQMLAERKELRGFDLSNFSFDFSGLSGAQHFFVGLNLSHCNSGRRCKTCYPVLEMYRDAVLPHWEKLPYSFTLGGSTDSAD